MRWLNVVSLYPGVGTSENICRRGDRIATSSDTYESFRISWIGELASSSAIPKMSVKSVKKNEISGAGILSVGANTMPTFRTVILFTSELSTISMRNDDRWRSSSKLFLGSLCTRTLKL